MLGILRESFGDAGKLEDEQGCRDVPKPELRQTATVPNLDINVAGQPAGDVVGQPGSMGGGTPWTEQGLSEPLGWLGDVLRGEVNAVDWSGRSIPVSPVVDELGAEPTVEGGAVNPSELIDVALRRSGGGRSSQASATGEPAKTGRDTHRQLRSAGCI